MWRASTPTGMLKVLQALPPLECKGLGFCGRCRLDRRPATRCHPAAPVLAWGSNVTGAAGQRATAGQLAVQRRRCRQPAVPTRPQAWKAAACSYSCSLAMAWCATLPSASCGGATDGSFSKPEGSRREAAVPVAGVRQGLGLGTRGRARSGGQRRESIAEETAGSEGRGWPRQATAPWAALTGSRHSVGKDCAGRRRRLGNVQEAVPCSASNGKGQRSGEHQWGRATEKRLLRSSVSRSAAQAMHRQPAGRCAPQPRLGACLASA